MNMSRSNLITDAFLSDFWKIYIHFIIEQKKSNVSLMSKHIKMKNYHIIRLYSYLLGRK